MRKSYLKLMVGAAAAAGLFVMTNGTANAISGQCSDCHTMHNSQAGLPMTIGTTLAQDYLLRAAGCVGCHSGPPSAATPVNAQFSAPVVVHTGSAPTYFGTSGGTNQTLAGGSFWWVADAGANQDDKGHNVVGVSGADGNFGGSGAIYPPGDVNDSSGLGAGTTQLECTTCHLAGAHHYNVGGVYGGSDGWTDGSTAGASYRFLTGRPQGGEDNDWEFTYASNDHNAYFAAETIAGGAKTFQSHCAICHGDFHGTYSASDDTGAGDGTAPWKRHPTDFGLLDTASGSEYRNALTYEVQSPVGTSITGAAGMNWTAIQTAGRDLVVCTSCHRAHGSPYADMVRWSYFNSVTAGTNTGNACFVCHTTK